MRHAALTILLSLSALGALALSPLVACDAQRGCVSDSQCELGFSCVNATCVGPQVEEGSDAYLMYRDELHNRLAADCGVCHGVRGAGSSAGRYTPVAEIPEEDPQPLDVLDLPPMPVALGDSAWRIYLDDLTDERLIASYQDTAEYINLDDPDRSLLLAYARGEMNVKKLDISPAEREQRGIPSTQGVQHPVIYQPGALPVGDCLASINAEVPPPLTLPLDPAAAPPSPARLSYERVLSWARLPSHSSYQGAKRLDLDRYRSSAQQKVKDFCRGCHNAEGSTKGGFCVQVDAQGPNELHILAPLINHTNIDESAIIGFFDGQFDHPPLNKPPEKKEEFKQAIRSWVLGR